MRQVKNKARRVKTMTQTQFIKKIRSMKKDINEYVEKESLRLFNSGAIDRSTYAADFLLPKIILCATLENLCRQYLPLGDRGKKELANLRHF
jgi:hypothetical protein